MAIKLQLASSVIKNSKLSGIAAVILIPTALILVLILVFTDINYCSVNTVTVRTGILTWVQAVVIIAIFSFASAFVFYNFRSLNQHQLVLDNQGIQYQSGLPTWLQFSLIKDWAMRWEEIKFIQVKKSVDYEGIRLDIYSKIQDNPIYVFPFIWIDSQTLDESHTKNPYAPKENAQSTSGFTEEQYKLMLLQSPLVKHLIQYNVDFQSFVD